MYYEKIKWNTNFKNYFSSLKPFIRDKGWTVIPQEHLLSISSFEKLSTTFTKHNLSIKNAILRKVIPGQFTGIHVDDIEYNNSGRIPKEVSLNIALHNETSAITRWYDFGSHAKFSNLDFLFSNIKSDFPLLHFSEVSITECLSYCIEETIMSEVMLINTSVPHNVDTRQFTDDRWILSIGIIDIENNEPLRWKNRKKVLDIQF